jgi:hypothetical protein
MDVVTLQGTAKVVATRGTARKLAVELIRTFFLVFTIGASVYSGISDPSRKRSSPAPPPQATPGLARSWPS